MVEIVYERKHSRSRTALLLNLRDFYQQEREDKNTPWCYIAGPMRGIPDFNIPAFKAAAKELRAHGWNVYSPAENDEEAGLEVDPDGENALPLKNYMVKDLAQVCSSDVVFVLPGWQDSRGASLEVYVARGVDVPVYEFGGLRLAGKVVSGPRGGDLGSLPERGQKPTNPKDLLGSGKLPIHLWPETATYLGCLALLDGALKYGRSNWRAVGVRASIYVDALRRHVGAWFEGESHDPDSGLPHLAHALACLAILVDAQAADNLVDDRQFGGDEHREFVRVLTHHVTRLKEKHGDKSPHHYTIADKEAV